MTAQANNEVDGARAGLSRRRYAAAALTVLVGEALVTAAALTPGVSVTAPLFLHVLTMTFSAALALPGGNKGDDKARAMTAMLAVAVCGPAGAIAALITLAIWWPRTEDRMLLEEWYLRLGRAGAPELAQRLLERIDSGRVQQPDTELPENFIVVLKSGSLDQRQKALGLIARRFHPDYSRVLQAALRAPEPIVRVQASAVAARVREELRARVGFLLAEHTDASRSLDVSYVSELQALQGCPFVDPLQRLQCRKKLAAHLDASLTRRGDIMDVAARIGSAGLMAIETFLLDQQRLREFRVARRVGRISSNSWLKIRRIAAGGAA